MDDIVAVTVSVDRVENVVGGNTRAEVGGESLVDGTNIDVRELVGE